MGFAMVHHRKCPDRYAPHILTITSKLLPELKGMLMME